MIPVLNRCTSALDSSRLGQWNRRGRTMGWRGFDVEFDYVRANIRIMGQMFKVSPEIDGAFTNRLVSCHFGPA